MGFLSGIFGKKEAKAKKQEEKPLPFTLLEDIKQLDEIDENSENELIGIFKHSTRCGTSRMAFSMFESNFNCDLKNVHIYVLDLLAYREISNEIEARYQVMHQSPQLILIKDKNAIHHSSHHQIAPAIVERIAEKVL